MQRDQQQLAALQIPGGWSWQTVEVGRQAWRLLLPAEGDAFITDATEAEEWPDPYWAQIWPAARKLAALVLAAEWRAGTKVFELGCGSGLVGLAALARGCQVTFSDYVPLAVELAVANARGNGFEQARGLVLDWRMPTHNEQCDVILGADLLYDEQLHQPLLDTMARQLTAGGFAWLADPGRSELAGRLSKWGAASGWAITLFDEQGHGADDLPRGAFRLLELRKAGER